MLASRIVVAQPFSVARCGQRRQRMVAACAMDTSQTIAATQQLVAFAILAGGEGYWAWSRMAEGRKGRPSLVPTVAGVGAIVAHNKYNTGKYLYHFTIGRRTTRAMPINCNTSRERARGLPSELKATVLLQVEATQQLATVGGLGVSVALLAYYIKRAIDVKGAPSDWPGPKVPVLGMALVAFFVVNIFAEGLR